MNWQNVLLSLYTDDECLYFGVEKGNDNAKKSEKSYVVPYRGCPVSSVKSGSKLAVLSETDLGNSKSFDNDITFVFENDDDDDDDIKSKDKGKKDSKKKKSESKKDKEEVKEKKKSKDSKDKDDKKDKKGKDKKDKGKNTQDDDDDNDDGFFQLGNWW